MHPHFTRLETEPVQVGQPRPALVEQTFGFSKIGKRISERSEMWHFVLEFPFECNIS